MKGKVEKETVVNVHEFLQNFKIKAATEEFCLFIGAGISVDSRAPTWNGLLNELTKHFEPQLPLLNADPVKHAAYLKKRHGEEKVNDFVANRFKSLEPNENHRAIVQFLKQTKVCYTTNFDLCIEKACEEANIPYEVKYKPEQVSNNTSHTKDTVTIYKINGTAADPSSLVYALNEYISFDKEKAVFRNMLKGAFPQKTFIFLGLSLQDQILLKLLEEVYIAWNDTDPRIHYYITKKVLIEDCGGNQEALVAAEAIQQMHIEAVGKMGLLTVLQENFFQTSSIVREMTKLLEKNRIFISGAYPNPFKISPDEYKILLENPDFFEQLPKVQKAAQKLIKNFIKNKDVITYGSGQGISDVMAQTVFETTQEEKLSITKHLITVQFPQERATAAVYTALRTEMIPPNQYAIFIWGIKLQDNSIALSSGMREEYQIAEKHGLICIPIGATGGMTLEIFKNMKGKIDSISYLKNEKVREIFLSLENKNIPLEEHMDNVLLIIKLLEAEYNIRNEADLQVSAVVNSIRYDPRFLFIQKEQRSYLSLPDEIKDQCPIDFEKFCATLEAYRNKITIDKHKEYVFLIGLEDSGKTTLASYMSGQKVYIADNSRNKSQTIVPTLYELNNNNNKTILLDFPGFILDYDNSDYEKDTISEIISQLTLNQIEKIKLAIIVIDSRTITYKNGRDFKKLIRHLSNFFNCSFELSSHIHFVITRARADEITGLKETARKFRDVFNGKNEQHLFDLLIKFLDAHDEKCIIENFEDTLFRESLNEKISASQSLPKKAVNNFALHSTDRKNLNVIHEIIKNYLKKCELITNYEKDLTIHKNDKIEPLEESMSISFTSTFKKFTEFREELKQLIQFATTVAQESEKHKNAISFFMKMLTELSGQDSKGLTLSDSGNNLSPQENYFLIARLWQRITQPELGATESNLTDSEDVRPVFPSQYRDWV